MMLYNHIDILEYQFVSYITSKLYMEYGEFHYIGVTQWF